MRRALVLLDGEHHPPVLRRALDELRARGIEPVEAVMLGGGEKVAVPGRPPDLAVPTRWPPDAERELAGLVRDLRPDVVVELSGEPVVGPRRRLVLAAIVLSTGVPYETPGMRLDPPDTPRLTRRPTVAVVATGKRTGKTALSGALTRHALDRGRSPVVVAMGRGGPPDPVVVRTTPTIDDLLDVAERGGHAASDFYEDAYTTGVPAVGCHRVGDGPAGTVAFSNVAAGVTVADDLGGDLIVLEGSGAALPPCAADAVALIVPAHLPATQLAAGLPLTFALADGVVVTLADTVPGEQLDALLAQLRQLLGAVGAGEAVPIAVTAFRPQPLADVAGRRVLVATTAPASAGPALAADLEHHHGAQVVAVTHHLADRPRLVADLEAAPPHDVVLTELKAAGVDVAARWARDHGRDVVVLDHRPVGIGGGSAELGAVLDHLLAVADASRYATG